MTPGQIAVFVGAPFLVLDDADLDEAEFTELRWITISSGPGHYPI
jgi:hypothetical protein